MQTKNAEPRQISQTSTAMNSFCVTNNKNFWHNPFLFLVILSTARWFVYVPVIEKKLQRKKFQFPVTRFMQLTRHSSNRPNLMLMIMMKHNLAVASRIGTRIFSYGCPDISQLFRISNLFKMCKNVDGRINYLSQIDKDAVFPKLTHRSIEILYQNSSFRKKYICKKQDCEY